MMATSQPVNPWRMSRGDPQPHDLPEGTKNFFLPLNVKVIY